jgi:hypothetical protein
MFNYQCLKYLSAENNGEIRRKLKLFFRGAIFEGIDSCDMDIIDKLVFDVVESVRKIMVTPARGLNLQSGFQEKTGFLSTSGLRSPEC